MRGVGSQALRGSHARILAAASTEFRVLGCLGFLGALGFLGLGFLGF